MIGDTDAMRSVVQGGRADAFSSARDKTRRDPIAADDALSIADHSCRQC